MKSIKETSIIQVLGGKDDPIGAMRRFTEQHENGNYSAFDMNTLSEVFSGFLKELDETELSGKDRKRDLGKLFVKHFEGKVKVQQENLAFDVRTKIEIDAVIYYKIYFEKGNSASLKKKIVELIFSKYRIPSFSEKTFEGWHTKWTDHVDELLKNSESRNFHVRQMESRLEDNLIKTRRLSEEEKIKLLSGKE